MSLLNGCFTAESIVLGGVTMHLKVDEGIESCHFEDTCAHIFQFGLTRCRKQNF